MEEKEFRRTDGSCVISEEVISSIASAAAVEVPGVAGMAQRPADIRGIIGSAAARAVRVLNNDSETVLDVYINLKQGARIPDVAGEDVYKRQPLLRRRKPVFAGECRLLLPGKKHWRRTKADGFPHRTGSCWQALGRDWELPMWRDSSSTAGILPNGWRSSYR